MPAGLKQLMRDHDVIRAVMDAVEREIAAAVAGRPLDADLIVLSLRYLRDFPEWFHHPREEVLFALAIRKDPAREAAMTEILAQVMAEHDAQPTSNERLLDTFEALAADGGQPQEDTLADLRRYIEDQRRHMQRENEEIFPALLAVLDEAEWNFEALADPLHGTRDPGAFRPLLDRIAVRR